MFEEIFFPRTAERYRAAPLAEQRERYLVHLKETGARRPDLAEMRQRSVELGAPSEAERRRQSARFADRGRGRDLVATEGTQV